MSRRVRLARRSPLAHALLACALLAGAPACKSSSEFPPAWKEGELSVPSDRLLWEVTVFALESERFPVGSGLDPTTRVATSGWKHSLAPFRNQGWREQAQVRYELVAPGRYRVEVRVVRQTNDDMVRPLDLRYAKWKDGPDDEETAQVLLQRIKAWVGVAAETPPRAGGSSPGGPR